ncbi:MAG: 2-hydroxyacyl-CoA dehydratase [Planctomycetota bacterium]
MTAPRLLDLAGWDARHKALHAAGLEEPAYGGPLRRHAEQGDTRLSRLRFDDSPAALRLWNFLLSEEDRLRRARADGAVLVGALKDLGTVPVIACAHPALRAFYLDGAWWLPCVMELSAGLLRFADDMGLDQSFCPVRALLGAYHAAGHYPRPDTVVCDVGATCDDVSAIAQRLAGTGVAIEWWEMPHRRSPDADETAVALPGGLHAPAVQVAQVHDELARLTAHLAGLAPDPITPAMLRDSIVATNRVRSALARLRELAFTAPRCPLPALELLIAEMLAIHFCSDRDECIAVLDDLLATVTDRVRANHGHFAADAVRVFWVNPVADLAVMNLLEDCGGRLCGTEFLFCHAIDPIPEDLPPLEALARSALADPMVGPTADRAARVVRDAQRYGAEAVVISRIPGASHCAWEGAQIAGHCAAVLGIPVVEIEVPPVSDASTSQVRTRLEALVETARGRRRKQ